MADFGGGKVTDTRSRIWSQDRMVSENPPGNLTDNDDDLIQISDTTDSDTVGAMEQSQLCERAGVEIIVVGGTDSSSD